MYNLHTALVTGSMKLQCSNTSYCTNVLPYIVRYFVWPIVLETFECWILQSYREGHDARDGPNSGTFHVWNAVLIDLYESKLQERWSSMHYFWLCKVLSFVNTREACAMGHLLVAHIHNMSDDSCNIIKDITGEIRFPVCVIVNQGWLTAETYFTFISSHLLLLSFSNTI